VVSSTEFKRPESVLVVVHTRTGKVLLLHRVDRPDFWQSVTGSLKWHEQPMRAAVRELKEETGLDGRGRLRDWDLSCRFEILPGWSRRFPPGTTHNLEHVFSLTLENEQTIILNPREHDKYCWLGVLEAARKVWSWTNRAAIERLIVGDDRLIQHVDRNR